MHQVSLEIANPPDSVLEAVSLAVLDHDELAFYILMLIRNLVVGVFLLSPVWGKDSASSKDMHLLFLIKPHDICPWTNFLFLLGNNAKPAHFHVYLTRLHVVVDLQIV